MATEPPRPEGVRAVLIGVSAYEYSDFPPIRAARNSLEAMHAVLADPSLCAWPPDRIIEIANPTSAAELADQLTDLAEGTTDVFLLYYVGHGTLSASGELCLTVTSTRPDRPKISGLTWDTLAEVLRACPAATRLVILDCCFSGQAIETLSHNGDGLADITYIRGAYTLTATTRNQTAHVPPPEQQDTACTSFTGELIDLLHAGIPGGPPQLSLGYIYPVLRQRLRAKGLPIPSQRGTDTSHQFPFTVNVADHVDPSAGPVDAAWDISEELVRQGGPGRKDRFRALRLLHDAEVAADSVSSTRWQLERASLRADIALIMFAVSPGHAERLINEAEKEVARFASYDRKNAALVRIEIAEALALADPDRAERIARSITDKRWLPNTALSELALSKVAPALAASDPDRAERIARSIIDERLEATALARIAEAVATTDPERAERIIWSINTMWRQRTTLGGIVDVMAARDPDRAERIAWSGTDEEWKASGLIKVAEVLAVSDRERAIEIVSEIERSAHSLISTQHLPSILTRIARVVAISDRKRAEQLITESEHIARSITDKRTRELSFTEFAEALARRDPDHAESIAREITDADLEALALSKIVERLASSDPDRAKDIATSITSEKQRDLALATIAETLAYSDPDRAEDIAKSIKGNECKAHTLIRLAKVAIS